LLTVIVRDEPATQGSKRAFAIRKGGVPTGQVAVVDDNKASLRGWREAVRQETAKAIEEHQDASLFEVTYPLQGPVVLGVTFTVRKPKNAPKRKVTWPERQPDLDKLLRAVCDALRAGGAYRDDAQVVEVARLAKCYPNPDGDSVMPVMARGANVMLAVTGTRLDVLSTPGAVIRVASIYEFPGVTEGA